VQAHRVERVKRLLPVGVERVAALRDAAPRSTPAISFRSVQRHAALPAQHGSKRCQPPAHALPQRGRSQHTRQITQAAARGKSVAAHYSCIFWS
jgi:hypothetical protein